MKPRPLVPTTHDSVSAARNSRRGTAAAWHSTRVAEDHDDETHGDAKEAVAV